MFRFLTALVFVACSSNPGHSLPLDAKAMTRNVFGAFDIQYRFLSTPSAEVAQAFAETETFWEAQTLGYASQALADRAIANLRNHETRQGRTALNETTALIEVEIESIDGVGGTPTAAGVLVTAQTAANDGTVSAVGAITLDADDVGFLAARDFLLPLVKRQTGLALGFATLFQAEGLIDRSGPSPVYTGEFAISTYNREFGNTDTNIPLDPNAPFWDESGFGNFGADNNPELFTRILNASSFISDTSIAAFDDLGYVTRLDHAIVQAPPVPLPPSALMLLGGLGALALVRTQKRGRPRETGA